MTGFEQFKEFLATPQISDILSFASLMALFIMQLFIKRFVRKDNAQMLFSVGRKTENTDKLRRELQASLEEVRQEREMYEKEKARLEEETAALKKEIREIKRVIHLGFGSVDGLVKSGTARKLAKMLPADMTDSTVDQENVKE